MSEFDVVHTHREDFDSLIKDLEVTKYKAPEHYDFFADIVRGQRERIHKLANINDLPEVPEK